MPGIQRNCTPMVFWTWGDEAIENPRKIKIALEALHEAGVKGFLVMLKNTRYTLFDRRVIRAVSQVSQWSKKRGLSFWIHMDPRHASRKFIQDTGENLQYILFSQATGMKPVTPLIDPHFEIEFKWPPISETAWLQEAAISVQPVSLERAFIFQTIDGKIAVDTINDITAHTNMTSNMAKRTTLVFGEMHLPEDETWYVCAFPKFDTNLYDYAGRESNDSMSVFIEDLFDGCTHLDGIAWAEGGPPAMVPQAFLPVSLSIFNSFKSEMGYSLQSKLYALVFECSNNEHLSIRHDYFNFLNKLLLTARHDFYRNLHSFFPGVQLGAHHQRIPSVLANQRNSGCIDPWRNMQHMQAGFCLIEATNGSIHRHLLARLIALKSMAAQGQRYTYCSLDWDSLDDKDRTLLVDWMLVLGLEISPQLHHSGEISDQKQSAILSLINRQKKHNSNTLSPYPITDTAMIYPFETLITADQAIANDTISHFAHWSVDLMLAGIQIDIFSSTQLSDARLIKGMLHLCGRQYRQLVFPYPSVLDDKTISMLHHLHSQSFPIFFMGCNMQYNLKGQSIDVLDIPVEDSANELVKRGLKPLLISPPNTIAALYETETNWAAVVAPLKSDIAVEGEIQFGSHKITIPRGKGLQVIEFIN
ncbi:hypothetical protein KAR48_02175 [bacterium]|nr:hypothetical protein [bacterium]